VNYCVIQSLKTGRTARLPIATAAHPLWGPGGISVETYSKRTSVYRLLLFDQHGHKKRQLFKARLPDSEQLYGIPSATLITKRKVFTREVRRNNITRIRAYSTHSGKQISSRDFPSTQDLYFDPDGDRVLTVSNSGGELDSVDLRTGARTILIASGISFVSTD
jgi:hypothetical protein